MSYVVETALKQEPTTVDFSKVALGPWSFSKLKMLQQCPLKFYLTYIVKVKVKDPPPSLVTSVGKAVHRILEFLVMGKSISDSYKLTKKEFVGILTDEEWEAEVATTEFNVLEFRRRLDEFEKKYPIKRYIQELKIGMTEAYEPTGFFSGDVYWRGVVDLGMQLESNDVIILDHKTGGNSEMGIRNFQNQLDVYKILFHSGVEQVEGAQAGIHFVKDGKIVLGNYTAKDEIDGRLRTELEFYVTGSIDKLKEIGYFKHFRGFYCKYCNYNEDCAAGNIKDIELKTKRFFPIKEVK